MDQLAREPATCGCGQQRAVTDPSVVVTIHVQDVPSRVVAGTLHSFPPRIRACSSCGALYVAALAGVPEPPRPPRSPEFGFGDK